ncbi:MAG: protein-glutamine glutaminase family protein [Bacteriovoracaceae bacterium]
MSIKPWLLVLALLFAVGARADEIFTTVYNVLDVDQPDKKVLLVLSGADGKVYRSNRTDENSKYLKSLIGKVVQLTYSTDGTKNYVNGIRLVNRGEVDETVFDLNRFQYNDLRKFTPTDLQSLENVTEIFNDLLNDGDKGRSQCFKRAHMWAFDMWSKKQITSQKIFMFYTDRYQIGNDFDWWFHVAPLVVANGVDYVMDGTFFDKPVTVKEWTDKFMYTDKIHCPAVTNYLDFEDHQWTKLCYTMKAPMYYFRPLDLEMRDKKGEKRNHWVLPEIQDARRAFKGWEETYEGLDTGKPTVKF